jgi:N-acetyl-1-D-myo-inositol-2-amino-2-deoxy-alpha-D-glucopyranoside deacetylase/mycothiol S-conjugate amidase
LHILQSFTCNLQPLTCNLQPLTPMPHPKSLLAVFAHPDDESFGPGGTLAKYAAEGAEVWLVCATDGDAGTVDAEMLADYASMSQLRAAELCCAAQTLGLRGVDWLGYRDSGMAGSPDNEHPASLYQAPLDEVTGKIVASMRQHRPQVVICDNQFGGYGHPDHIKLHQATVRAFEVANDAAHYPEAGPPGRAAGRAGRGRSGRRGRRSACWRWARPARSR